MLKEAPPGLVLLETSISGVLLSLLEWFVPNNRESPGTCISAPFSPQGLHQIEVGELMQIHKSMEHGQV